MKTRGIFGGLPKELQQGCLFNGAIANGYNGCDVYGLIITPRCDIAQRKVSTVHYLPVVRFDDWKSHYLVNELRSAEGEKINRMFSAHLAKYNLTHLLDPRFRVEEETLNKIGAGALQKSCIDGLLRWWSMFDSEKCEEILFVGDKYKSYIANLADGKLERFLLLENWDGKEEYYVICLTEINRLQFTIAEKLIAGVLARDVDFTNNDLYDDSVPLRRYSIVNSLFSPYVEYVCQRFSNAFFRVGIEDWPSREIVINL